MLVSPRLITTRRLLAAPEPARAWFSHLPISSAWFGRRSVANTCLATGGEQPTSGPLPSKAVPQAPAPVPTEAIGAESKAAAGLGGDASPAKKQGHPSVGSSVPMSSRPKPPTATAKGGKIDSYFARLQQKAAADAPKPAGGSMVRAGRAGGQRWGCFAAFCLSALHRLVLNIRQVQRPLARPDPPKNPKP